MIGAVIELLLSWVLLRLVEHEGLSVLGLRPTRWRILVFLGGLLVPLVVESGWRWVEALLYRNPYRLNPVYGWKDLGLMSWYLVKSVVFEDLAFRGALLYILMRRLGPERGLWLSAIAFGIYHWFSFGVFGQMVYMIIVFIMTGLAGYAQGRAFQRTGTIWLGFAFHFSTDLVGMGLFGVKNALFVKHFSANPRDYGPLVSLGLLSIHLAIYVLSMLWFISLVARRGNVKPVVKQENVV